MAIYFYRTDELLWDVVSSITMLTKSIPRLANYFLCLYFFPNLCVGGKRECYHHVTIAVLASVVSTVIRVCMWGHLPLSLLSILYIYCCHLSFVT